MQYGFHGRGPKNKSGIASSRLVPDPSDLFSRETGHNCNSRDVRGPASQAVVFCRYADECSLGYFCELAVTDSSPKKRSGERSQCDQQCVQDLTLDVVFHGREI